MQRVNLRTLAKFRLQMSQGRTTMAIEVTDSAMSRAAQEQQASFVGVHLDDSSTRTRCRKLRGRVVTRLDAPRADHRSFVHMLIPFHALLKLQLGASILTCVFDDSYSIILASLIERSSKVLARSPSRILLSTTAMSPV